MASIDPSLSTRRIYGEYGSEVQALSSVSALSASGYRPHDARPLWWVFLPISQAPFFLRSRVTNDQPYDRE